MSGRLRPVAATIAILRAGWRGLLAGALAGALAGLGWGLADEPEYAATATVIVIDRGEAAELVGAGAVGGSGPAATERLLELARSEDVAELAAAGLGGDVPGADLLARTSFRGGDRGGSLVVRSTAGFPDFASAAASAFAGAVVEFGTLLERRRLSSAEERLGERLLELDPASEQAIELQERLDAIAGLQELGPPLRAGREPELPLAAQPARSVLGSTLVGAAAGLLVVLLSLAGRELYRRPVRRPEQLQKALGVDVVTVIGPAGARRGPRPASSSAPDRLEEDRMQALATSVGLVPPAASGSALAVVSAMPGEGRTTVALGLAAAAARRGVRVLLLEADLRRPSLAERLQLGDGPGLSEYLIGEAAPREVIRTVALPSEIGDQPPSFVCVTAGGARSSPVEVLSGPRLANLIDQLRRVYDSVIVDTAALLPSVDGSIVAAAVGKALFCARVPVTRGAEVSRATALLREGTLVAGVLLGADHSGPGVRLLPPSGPPDPDGSVRGLLSPARERRR